VILAGVWGLLASTRLMRGEEEAGRWELVVAGGVSAAGATGAALAALGIWFALAFVVLSATLVGLGLAAGDSALLSAGVFGAGIVFGAVGAVTSQLVPVRRRAASLAGIVLGVAVLLRVVADGTANLGWLRGVTPLGWIENVRPFAGSVVVWLVPLVLASGALVMVALRLATRRDLGAGALWSGDTRTSSDRWLGSAPGFAARSSLMPIVVWTICVGVLGAVLGLLAVDVAAFAARSSAFLRIASHFGGIDLGTAAGFLGLAFSIVVVPVCLFPAFRLQAARDEEATGRIDNILSRAVGRRTWLLSQAGVAFAGAAVVAGGTAAAAWIGVVSRGAPLGAGRMAVAALNCLPIALLFIGIGLVAFALVPREAPAITLGVIGLTYLLQLIGALANVPRVVLAVSPFHHVAASPAVGVNVAGALTMLALGFACCLVGAELFARRDVAGA
jgi:ABC-2 type transport system permease protein